jgi:hypothetical protein
MNPNLFFTSVTLYVTYALPYPQDPCANGYQGQEERSYLDS